MEGRSIQMVRMSGGCADRNAQYTNAGRPLHRDLQIVVVYELHDDDDDDNDDDEEDEEYHTNMQPIN